MKLLLLPFAAIAAFETTIFVLARIAERIGRKRLPKEVLSFERRSALRSRNSPPDPNVRAASARKQPRPVRSLSAAEPKRTHNHPTSTPELTETSS